MNQYFKFKISTPLGNMIALTDELSLLFLQFEDHIVFNKKYDLSLLPFKNAKNIHATACLIEQQITAYFNGTLKQFTINCHTKGTAFQRTAWETLTRISYGETRSYTQEASMMSAPTAHRACANANAKNPISIIIPCHRIIRNDGTLGGYAGGIERKKWLIAHEAKYA